MKCGVFPVSIQHQPAIYFKTFNNLRSGLAT